MTKQNPDLTPEQQAVLFDKATEAPFSGKLLHVTDDGMFVCANCGAQLFDSSAKYDSGCGWPSFDRALAGAVSYHDDN